MSKKILSVLFFSIIVLLNSVYAGPERPVILINDKHAAFPDQQPFFDESDRTVVPIRFISEYLGADVEWIQETRQIKITLYDKEMILTQHESAYYINGVRHLMDTIVSVAGGRTMVPLRFVSEGLGATVNWCGETKLINITKEELKVTSSRVLNENIIQVTFSDGGTIIHDLWIPLNPNELTKVSIPYRGRTFNVEVNWVVDVEIKKVEVINNTTIEITFSDGVRKKFLTSNILIANETIVEEVLYKGKTFNVPVTWQGDTADRREEITTEEIVEMAGPATVSIWTADSTGSGFIIECDGKVITNHHVIEGSSWARARLTDGRIFDVVSIYYYDKDRDIVILNIDGLDLPTLRLGDSDTVRAGQDAIVIGSPLGFLVDTVTKGIISNAARLINGQVSIQLDAAVSGGNSGGPVLNDKGEVIGVIYAGFEDKETLNLAIPINDVKPHLNTNWNLTLLEFTGESRTPDTHKTTIVEHLTLVCGGIYSGEMRNGRLHGWGSLITAEDEIHMGQWKEGWLHGMAWSWWDDNIRIGTWYEGKMVGLDGWFFGNDFLLITGDCETIEFANGFYMGQTRNGASHGWGAYFWDNGDTFLGEFRNGLEHGIGIYTWKDSGTEFIGKWENGEWTEVGAWFNYDYTLWH